MRRTKATLIYRRTKNLRAVQLLLRRACATSSRPTGSSLTGSFLARPRTHAAGQERALLKGSARVALE